MAAPLAPPPVIYTAHSQAAGDADLMRRGSIPPTIFEIAVYDGKRLVWSGPLHTAGEPFDNSRYQRGQGDIGFRNTGPVLAACRPHVFAEKMGFVESFSMSLEPNQYLGGPGDFRISVSWDRPTKPLVCDTRDNTITQFDVRFDVEPGRTVTLKQSGMTVRIHRN